jgi:hypothetical protein
MRSLAEAKAAGRIARDWRARGHIALWSSVTLSGRAQTTVVRLSDDRRLVVVGVGTLHPLPVDFQWWTDRWRGVRDLRSLALDYRTIPIGLAETPLGIDADAMVPTDRGSLRRRTAAKSTRGPANLWRNVATTVLLHGRPSRLIPGARSPLAPTSRYRSALDDLGRP